MSISSIMCKKKLGMFLIGTTFIVCSCVDNTYDIANKEVATDVKIEGNQVTLPLGSLQAFMLESIINVDSLEMINQTNGMYSINFSDTIKPYTYKIPEITFQIPSQKVNFDIGDFDEVNISNVDIAGKDIEGMELVTPDVSLDNLKLPELSINRSMSTANEQVKEFESFFDSDMIEQLGTIKFNQTFTINDGTIEFNMDYTLPKEVKSISTIMLESAGDENDSENGALIGFEIIHPQALQNLNKSIKFEIAFPEQFVLAKDPTAKGNYVINDNTITVSELKVNAGEEASTNIRFYLNRLENLDKQISNGQFKLDETITYTVEYSVNGDLKVEKGTKLSDFDFIVKSDLDLAVRDVKGETNDIEIEFESTDISFDIDLDNLEYIDRIEYIDFDESQSQLHFHSEIEGGFTPFALKEGYALKLEFPKEITICESLSEYPRTNLNGEKAVEYIEDEHAFYIYDIEVFNSSVKDTDDKGTPLYSHWRLALDRFDLHQDVVDGQFHHDITAKVTAVKNGASADKLMLAGATLNSFNETFASFDDKKINFEILESNLIIDDAFVHTEAISSPLEHTVSFEFENSDLPKEIRRIESVGFDHDVPVFFKININGLEELSTNITLDLNVQLPSALKLETKEGDQATIVEDVLHINVPINTSSKEPALVELICKGFDFTKDGQSAGISPKLENGKGCIQYQADIEITGSAIVEDTDLHAEILNKDINMNVDFDMGDIKVQEFQGLFDIDDLGAIEEEIPLDLEFLKGENNSIVLSNPQIMVTIDNTISVPIGAEITLVGKDEAGIAIPSSMVQKKIDITPATYDKSSGVVTPQSTKLLLSAKPTELNGYQNIIIENLSNLLKEIPTTMEVSITPAIDTNATQCINIMNPLSFEGSYAIVIPLQFDELNFVYSDTITNLQADLSEIMEIFTNFEIGFNMDIKNSLPLQLNLKTTPLDERGKHISGIEISDLEIPAGNGQAFCDTIQGKKASFSIKSESDDIPTLDMLKFDIQASSINNTIGGAALRGDQGIQLSNIVLKITGDIETELGK